ncbi:hypothetical protein [Aeromonas popoffii]|uniref:hypothetical protein n=1 Tax=Aeromonas popoffii TaxID=70856 RepID=UPI002010DEC9|nr:hypothetical protein [Aeromonas popoffii]
MARKDASLALRKARSINGQLELNQSDVVRLVGILNSTNLPPSLSASPGLVLASYWLATRIVPALSWADRSCCRGG